MIDYGGKKKAYMEARFDPETSGWNELVKVKTYLAWRILDASRNSNETWYVLTTDKDTIRLLYNRGKGWFSFDHHWNNKGGPFSTAQEAMNISENELISPLEILGKQMTKTNPAKKNPVNVSKQKLYKIKKEDRPGELIGKTVKCIGDWGVRIIRHDPGTQSYRYVLTAEGVKGSLEFTYRSATQSKPVQVTAAVLYLRGKLIRSEKNFKSIQEVIDWAENQLYDPLEILAHQMTRKNPKTVHVDSRVTGPGQSPIIKDLLREISQVECVSGWTVRNAYHRMERIASVAGACLVDEKDNWFWLHYASKREPHWKVDQLQVIPPDKFDEYIRLTKKQFLSAQEAVDAIEDLLTDPLERFAQRAARKNPKNRRLKLQKPLPETEAEITAVRTYLDWSGGEQISRANQQGYRIFQPSDFQAKAKATIVYTRAAKEWNVYGLRSKGNAIQTSNETFDSLQAAMDHIESKLIDPLEILAMEVKTMKNPRAFKQARANSTYPRWVAEHPRGVYNLREVGPNLYVGAMASCVAAPIKWTAIYDFCGASREYIDDYPIKPVCLEFYDGEPIPPEYLDQVYAEVKKARGPVLLHCAQGLSRSASVAYAMLRRSGLDHLEALTRVQVAHGKGYPMKETLASAIAWVESAKTNPRATRRPRTTLRNPKNELDVCVDYLNAAINRFHEGKIGLALANMWTGHNRLNLWEEGLLDHVYPQPTNATDRQYEDWDRKRRDAFDMTHTGAMNAACLRAVGAENAAKFKFAHQRLTAALGLNNAIESNIQNAAHRNQQLYREYQKHTNVYGKANAARQGQGVLAAQVRDRQGKAHLEKLDVKLAVSQAAQDAEAWLSSTEPAAVFARKQIEKFKAGTIVQAKYGDSICERCGGAGFIAAFAHIDGGVCYECGGSGVSHEREKR